MYKGDAASVKQVNRFTFYCLITAHSHTRSATAFILVWNITTFPPSLLLNLHAVSILTCIPSWLDARARHRHVCRRLTSNFAPNFRQRNNLGTDHTATSHINISGMNVSINQRDLIRVYFFPCMVSCSGCVPASRPSAASTRKSYWGGTDELSFFVYSLLVQITWRFCTTR